MCTTGALGTVEADENNIGLTKNLSFENSTGLSYHQKYYYPKLVWSKICNRLEMDQKPGDEVVQQFIGSGERQTKIDYPSSGGTESGVTVFTPDSAVDEAASGLLEGQGPRKERISSNMSESESTDTSYSEDYTRMTDIGEGSDLETRSTSTAHDNSASTSGDELFDEAGSLLCTYDRDEREISPQMSENFKGINIDGVKTSPATKIKPLALELDMNDSVAGLQDPPPSPEADLQEEDTSASNVFEGRNLPSDYSAYEGCSFEDREFDFLKAEPIKRSTSLKTNKTPPGTPSRKKVVRFADALGLDLESVRHILNLEAPPKIPATALKDLKVNIKPLTRHIFAPNMIA